jgi:ABC-type Fe3+/spermidine/putrescine transport system ATPase subunit
MLRLTDLAVELGGFALSVDSLELTPGEYLVILGPNGAGKTVLLETVAGLHPVRGGRVEFLDAGPAGAGPAGAGLRGAGPPGAGRASGAGAPASSAQGGWTDVTAWPPEKRQVGFVYQDYLLFPHLSVAQNIGFGLKGRVPATDRLARVRKAAALTGVDGLLGRKVAGLSGGEQQKVALARACAIRPRLLLLDEPLAALDRSARREMADEVKGLCRELGVTTLHVTHSLDEAVSLGDRVAVLAGGRVLQIGSPEELLRTPVNRRVAELVGCENLLEGRLGGSAVAIAGGPTLVIEPGAGAAGDGPVTVALRAEDLVLETPGASTAGVHPNVFPALVQAVEPGPAHWTVKVRYAGESGGWATSGSADGVFGGDARQAPASGCVLTVFMMPPELSRLGLTPGAAVQVYVEPRRITICPA